jgi:PAS domain S-box-containing protein
VNDADLIGPLFERYPKPCLIFESPSLSILRVNAAMCERYGWTPEEFATMSLRDIRPPEDLPRLEYVVAERRKRDGDYRRGSRHRTKSGEVFDVEIEITAWASRRS